MSGNGKQKRPSRAKKLPNDNGGNGRDGKGRFALGSKGGPGRPKSARSAVMEHAWDENLTPKRARAIVRKTLALAIKGEQWAVQEVNNRSMGRPKETVNLTGAFTFSDMMAEVRGVHRAAAG